MKLTNRYNLPDAIVSAIRRDPYQRVADISSTSLIMPPRIFQLRKRYDDQIEEDVSDRIWALLGQIGHKILERADDYEAFHEETLTIEVKGWKVSCTTDSYRTKRLKNYSPSEVNGVCEYEDIPPIIQDYKFVKIGAHAFPHPEWEQQLNVNAHIWREHGFPVEKLEVVMIFKDWSKIQAERQGKDYPKPVIIKDIPIWSHKDAARQIEAWVLAHQLAANVRDELLPFCTPEDQWRQPTKWAVMSSRSPAKATKICKSEQEANEWIMEKPGGQRSRYYVQIRPGGPLRCTHFCDVRPFCNQYQLEETVENKRREAV